MRQRAPRTELGRAGWRPDDLGKGQEPRCRSTSDLFHLNGRLFNPSHRLTSGGRLPTFSGLPHRPFSFSKFPQSSGGSSPEASEDKARGLPPGQRPSAAAVPASGDLAPCGGWRGGGTWGGLCAVGAGPRRLLRTTIGRELRTGGRTSLPGPTLLAMSSDCCTPNLSIYSTGIEAAGAALAPANHGWDFLFRPLFVSLWDLRCCHRF